MINNLFIIYFGILGGRPPTPPSEGLHPPNPPPGGVAPPRPPAGFWGVRPAVLPLTLICYLRCLILIFFFINPHSLRGCLPYPNPNPNPNRFAFTLPGLLIASLSTFKPAVLAPNPNQNLRCLKVSFQKVT